MNSTCAHRRVVGDHHDVASTVSAARAVLSSLSGTLPRTPPVSSVRADEGLGSWTAEQDAYLNALVAMDAIRAVSDSVPQSLRSFFA